MQGYMQSFPQASQSSGLFMNKIFGGIADTNRMILGHSLAKDLITHREQTGAEFQMKVDTNREVSKAAANAWVTKKNYAANRAHMKAVNKMTNEPKVYPAGHKKAGQPNPNYWSGHLQAANANGTAFQKNPTFTGVSASEGETPNPSETNKPEQPTLF